MYTNNIITVTTPKPFIIVGKEFFQKNPTICILENRILSMESIYDLKNAYLFYPFFFPFSFIVYEKEIVHQSTCGNKKKTAKPFLLFNTQCSCDLQKGVYMVSNRHDSGLSFIRGRSKNYFIYVKTKLI